MAEREDPQAVYDQKEAARSAQRSERRVRLGHVTKSEVKGSDKEAAELREARQVRLGHVEKPKKKAANSKKETKEPEA